MTDVKNGDASANSSDAVNGAQLYAPQKIIINQNDRINNLDNKVDGLNDRVNNLNDKMDDDFAKSAALNGLFQPYGVGKFNFTAVVGGYGSTNAVAVGSGYRINENVAVKTGVALSNENKALYNVGVNIEW